MNESFFFVEVKVQQKLYFLKLWFSQVEIKNNDVSFLPSFFAFLLFLMAVKMQGILSFALQFEDTIFQAILKLTKFSLKIKIFEISYLHLHAHVGTTFKIVI